MIEVHYFASIRERLGSERESVPAGAPSVAALVEQLVKIHGAPWREALLDGKVLVAVNQVVADFQAPVVDGDEVAFFPPVTGG